MGYAALYWLTIHLAHGRAAVQSILVAAQFLPILLASRRAGTLVARYPRARVLLATQVLQAAGALAIGVPLLAGWMTVWYLWAVSFALGWVLGAGRPCPRCHGLCRGDVRREPEPAPVTVAAPPAPQAAATAGTEE